MIAPVLIALAVAFATGLCFARWAVRSVAPSTDAREALRAADGERFAALASQHARQQRRLGGILGEARRWKSIAKRLGWRRSGAAPGCRACGNGCVNCALAGAMRAVAAGLSVPPRRRWTTLADAVNAAPVAPEPVRPTVMILPPQESAEAAERMAATARRIIESTDAGGGA